MTTKDHAWPLHLLATASDRIPSHVNATIDILEYFEKKRMNFPADEKIKQEAKEIIQEIITEVHTGGLETPYKKELRKFMDRLSQKEEIGAEEKLQDFNLFSPAETNKLENEAKELLEEELDTILAQWATTEIGPEDKKQTYFEENNRKDEENKPTDTKQDNC